MNALGGMTFATSDREPHLGGNMIEGDAFCHCPGVWNYVIDRFGVRTAMDLGSGRGHAALHMARRGVIVIAVDGLRYNVENALYPTVQHDLLHGPIRACVDLVHCQEVAEHIPPTYVDSLIVSLASGRIVLMTHAVPGQGGHHHVNCQPSEYWIARMRGEGFSLLQEDTRRIRALAATDGAIHMANTGMIFSRN